jgi:hypothetical protein
MDQNKIVTITYNGLTFEMDVWGNHIFLPEDIIRLFPEDERHIEYQPTCLFFSRLVNNWDMKKNYIEQINGRSSDIG